MAWIKKVYLYLVSLISLVILVFAAIMLINMALKAWVFKKADQYNYYYPPKVVCETIKNTDGSTAPLPAECSDPNYQAKEEQRQKDERNAQRQRDASQAIAMILVATPVFYYHWKLARREA